MLTRVPARPGLTFEVFGSLRPGKPERYVARVMEHWSGDPSYDVHKCEHRHLTEGEAHDCALVTARELAARDLAVIDLTK